MSSAFFISIDIVLQFFFKFVIMENCIYFQMLNQPSILEVNPLCHDVLSFSLLSFSYIVELNLLTCCLQLCIYICFHSVIFDIMSFLCVVIRIMLTSVNELGSISSYSIFLKSFIALVLFFKCLVGSNFFNQYRAGSCYFFLSEISCIFQ